MMDKANEASMSREMKVLLIFLEYPSGLRFMELWRIVEDRKICAKETLNNILNKWIEQGLIEKNKLGRYTLGLTEPMAKIVKEGEYAIPQQVEEFLDTLYKAYEESGKKKTELFFHLAASYLSKKQRQMVVTTWFLSPFLFDRKISKLWFYGHTHILNLVFDKLDEISQKLYKVKISKIFRTKPIQEILIIPELERLAKEIKLDNEKTLHLIHQLDIKEDTKRKLKSQLSSEPFLDIFTKESKTFAKIIQALKETREESS